MNSTSPNQLQLDALREVANIGCGRAANALSQLVGGRRVEIGIPEVSISPVDRLSERVGGSDAPVVAATLGLAGELGGKMVLIFPEADAQRLAALLLNAPAQATLGDVQKSALSEAANIVASACLSAIGQLTGLKLLPSVPALVQDAAGLVMEDLIHDLDISRGVVLVLEARFFTSTAPIVGGQLLLLPDAESLRVLLSRLGV